MHQRSVQRSRRSMPVERRFSDAKVYDDACRRRRARPSWRRETTHPQARLGRRPDAAITVQFDLLRSRNGHRRSQFHRGAGECRDVLSNRDENLRDRDESDKSPMLPTCRSCRSAKIFGKRRCSASIFAGQTFIAAFPSGRLARIRTAAQLASRGIRLGLIDSSAVAA